MAITYDAPSNTITVTGYTEETPCTFEDIYQADVANGWGVVSKQGDSQYLFDACIVVGNDVNTSWLKDSAVQIEFSASCITANWQRPLIHVQNEGHFQLGTLLDATDKTTEDGVSILDTEPQAHALIDSDANSEINLYGSLFACTGYVSHFTINSDDTYKSQIYECQLDNVYISSVNSSVDVTLSRITQKHTTYGIRYMGGVMDDVYLHSNGYALYWYGGCVTTGYSITNLKARNNTYLILAYSLSESDNSYLINADVDNWNFSWANVQAGVIYRQYTFDAKCIDKNGNPINGVSAVGEYINPYGEAFSVSTGADGKIATQTTDHGFFDQTHGDTEQLKTPLKVTYSKKGLVTAVKYYVLDEKTKDTVLMISTADLPIIPYTVYRTRERLIYHFKTTLRLRGKAMPKPIKKLLKLRGKISDRYGFFSHVIKLKGRKSSVLTHRIHLKGSLSQRFVQKIKAVGKMKK